MAKVQRKEEILKSELPPALPLMALRSTIVYPLGTIAVQMGAPENLALLRAHDEPGLIVPHPRFRDRRFVLEPLAEIASELVDPVTGSTVGDTNSSVLYRFVCGSRSAPHCVNERALA